MFNAVEEKEIKDLFYWENKMKAIEKEMNIFNSKIKNKNSKKIKRASDYKIFEYAPKDVLLNEDLMIKALNKTFIYLFMLPDELKKSVMFNLRYLEEVSYAYHYNISVDVLKDEKIMTKCIQKDASSVNMIFRNYELRNKYLNEETIMSFLEINPNILEHMDVNYKKNIDIAKKAVSLNIRNINFLNKSVCKKVLDNTEMVSKVLVENKFKYEIYERINNKFFKDKSFLCENLVKCPDIFALVNKKYKSDYDILNLATPAWNFLDHIEDCFKSDKNLIKKHLSHNPFNYKKLDDYIDVKPIMVELIKKERYGYEYLSEEEKSNEDYIFAVLEHNEFYQKNKFSRYASFNYQKVSILKILPEKIFESLVSEYNIKNNSENKLIDDFENKLLKFARDKYLNIYLKKHLEQKNTQKSKIKL